ncbi:MAG TPA: hypothetical protein VFS88_00600 [Micavibrio sp.]|nr:hypothetical protein [Micavibrio sp.]
MNTEHNIPTPPKRLFDDTRVWKNPFPPEWERRRTNKMRERFYVRNHEPLQGASLISPVQPSVPPSYSSNRAV